MAYITGTHKEGKKDEEGGRLGKSVSVDDIILNSYCKFCIR